MKKVFPAKLEELDNVLAFVDTELDAAGCTPKTKVSVNVALEELFVNIVHYAYPDSEGMAEVEVLTGEDRCISVILSDSGVKFDPLERSDPDTTLGVDERAIGGLGIFMVKKLMDEVCYDYIDGKNVITMKKKF